MQDGKDNYRHINKMKKYFFVFLWIALIAFAEWTRIDILQRLRAGIAVTEYENNLSSLIQMLAYTPFGFITGFFLLILPQHVISWLDKLLQRHHRIPSKVEILIYRVWGLVLIIFTLAGLWNTSHFLLQ